MTPTLPPLNDDSIEAAERTLREAMAAKVADWIVAVRELPTPPPATLVEQAQRFLANVRDWSRR